MTNCEPGVTNPPAGGAGRRLQAWRRLPPLQRQLWLWWAALTPVALVNALSVSEDLRQRGLSFHPAMPWIWELSSVLMLALLLPWTLRALDSLATRLAGWRWLLGHAAASLLFSVAHVAGMVALRHGVYALAGWRYDAGPWLDRLVYEYRKDALVYAGLVALAWLWARRADAAPAAGETAASTRAPPPVPIAAPALSAEPAPNFLVRCGEAEEVVRAADIDWVQAQGNYVALHAQGRVRLLRQPLQDLEQRLLPHGFLRTHRGALVNLARVRAIRRGDDGHFCLDMGCAAVAPLSAGRRSAVARALRDAPAPL